MVHKPATTLAEAAALASAFPVNALSSDIQNVFRQLQNGNNVPSELIANILLTSISLACQSLIEVINPYTGKAEPCALYFMTMAESGMGKTTIKNQVMAPFYNFAVAIKQDYKCKLAAYEDELDVWNTARQALKSRFRAAIKKGDNGADEQAELILHSSNAPQAPVNPDILYNDVSPAALIEGLRRYSSAALITDEAITFFNSDLKNHLGFLNTAWDGGIYNYNRGNRESFSIKPLLTILLMVQPAICLDYLKKQGDTAKASGFLSRILFASVPPLNHTVPFGYRFNTTPQLQNENALPEFHDRIKSLLAAQKAQIDSGNMDKVQLMPDAQASNFWAIKREQWVAKAIPHQPWSCISDMVQKANTNTLRIAGALHYFSHLGSQTITLESMERAACIMEWYLDHAATLFYKFTPEYQLEQDAEELRLWIIERIHQNYGRPIRKNYALKYGPNRLRKSDKLNSLLNYLSIKGQIYSVQSHPNNPIYISTMNAMGIIVPPPDMQPLGRFVILPPYQPIKPAGF
ncbi:TPA: DUF3987 domain-containing protein [Citrobacter koseri]|nr:DUF3987 domain-containing protein [Citrobacter koseri]